MRRLAAILAITAITVVGCSDDDAGKTDSKDSVQASTAAASADLSSSSAGTAASASSPVSPSETAAATSTGSTDAGAAPAPAMGDAQATCEFLATTLPKLAAVGSPVGALAQLAVAYANFVEQQPGSKVPNSAELDAITTAECPAVRTGVLKILDAESFAGSL